MHLSPLVAARTPQTRAVSMCGRETIRIASFPNPNENPYLSLLYGHLARHGVERVPSPDYFSRSWIRAMVGRLDYVHFHWPSLDYSNAHGERTLIAMSRYIAKLHEARAYGIKSIWTMHNLYPHERQGLLKEWWCRFLLAQSVDLVFVTHEAAAQDLSRRFLRTRNVWLAPHGNYSPVYPKIPDKSSARRRLGLSESDYIVLLFGQIRRYKGADIAVRSLGHIPQAGVRLAIVGQMRDEGHVRELRALSRADPRISLHLSRDPVPDGEAAYWLAACDCIAAPYRDVYTSGVLYLAATFGKPLAAPRLGLFRSLADWDFAAIYEPSEDGRGLATALSAIRARDPVSIARSARKFCAAHGWDEIAAQIAGVLKDAKPRGISQAGP